jgi:formate/nitrite transporter FocA (FNT family)
MLFGKAVGANWLVNLAITTANGARSIASKVAAIWLPITTFVALGLEHAVANMFLIPLGM